jgi:hypothetical protein
MFRKFWNYCGEVRINFWLLLFISINLAVGSYYLKFNPRLFNPLNQLLLQEWFRDHGQYQAGNIWWLATLLILLFLLGVNTSVCAINRIVLLWPRRKQMRGRSFFHKICPAFIHLCFLFILFGHFLSLVSGVHRVIPVKPGLIESLPGQLRIQIMEYFCDRYSAPASLKGSIKQCRVSLKVLSAGTEEVSQIRFLEPLVRQGFIFHLDMAKRSGPQPDLKLIIKRDPGLKFIFLGFSILIGLMAGYFLQRKHF